MTLPAKKQFEDELRAIAELPIFLKLTGAQAWVLLCQLQLALRHPQNTGPTADIAHKIASDIQDIVAKTPALHAVAEHGWTQGQAPKPPTIPPPEGYIQ